MSAATAMRSCSAASAAAAAAYDSTARARVSSTFAATDRNTQPSVTSSPPRISANETSSATRVPVVAREVALDEPHHAEQERDERRPDDLEEERKRQHSGDRRDVHEVPDPRLRVGVGLAAGGGERPQDERERVDAGEDPRRHAHASTDAARDDHRHERHERHHHEGYLPGGALLGGLSQRSDERLRAEREASQPHDDGDDALDAQARERTESCSRLASLRDVSPRVVEDRAGALELRGHRDPHGRSAPRGCRPPSRAGADRPSSGAGRPTSTYFTRTRVMFSFAVEYATPRRSATTLSGSPAA